MDLLSIRIILVVVFILIFMLVMSVIFIVIYCKRKRALRGKLRPRFDRHHEESNSDAIQTFAFGQEVNEVPTIEPSVASSFMNENIDYFGGSASRHSRYTDIETKLTPHISLDYNNSISRRPPLQQPDVIQQDRVWFHRADSPVSHFVYDYTYAVPSYPEQHHCMVSGIFSESQAQIHQEEEDHPGCIGHGCSLPLTNTCSYAINSHPPLPNTIEIVSLVHEPPRHLEDIIQNTPLARFSPVSESSQQQQAMRILTLQDISRKQQPTTLFDSTSSSGNVSKGVLPSSNSETSWNTRPTVISDWSLMAASGSAREETNTQEDSLPSNLKYTITSHNIDTSDVTAKTVHSKVLADIAIAAPFDKRSSVTTESCDDDSFTCSEFEDDGARGPQVPCTDISSDLLRDYLSPIVTSDDELPSARSLNAGGEGTLIGGDRLLSWGPNINYELFEGVCNDIAELPDTVDAVSATTTSNNENESSSNPMEIYV